MEMRPQVVAFGAFQPSRLKRTERDEYCAIPEWACPQGDCTIIVTSTTRNNDCAIHHSMILVALRTFLYTEAVEYLV